MTEGGRRPVGPTGTYIYGLLPAGSRLDEPVRGVGGAGVEVAEFDGFAALVSRDVDQQAFGVPDDLLAHTRVLDEVARSHTVLPLAFGTFAADDGGAGIEAMREAYRASADRVDGAVQFTLTVRYLQDTALSELVAEDPGIARLRERTAGSPEDAFPAEKLQLGELVVQGLERKARTDADRILQALTPSARELVQHDRRQPDEVVEVAALVDRGEVDAFEERCAECAEAFAGRASFRLLGPQAPYDFVRDA